MHLDIKCFATLSRFTPAGGSMDVPPGTTMADVMQMLGVPVDEVKIMFINGTHVAPEAQLNEGDRVGLFPAVGGG